jgi:uncharacterized protein (DUF885 family)
MKSKESPAELFQNYYEDRLKLYPLEATMIGDSRYNDLLPIDISEDYRGKLKEFFAVYLDRIQLQDSKQLSESEQLSMEILAWECRIQLENLGFRSELIPINQFESLHLTIGQYAGGSSAQPFKTVKDYNDWLKRLDSFAAWSDVAIRNMQRGMQQGYVLQKALAGRVIEQLASLDHGPVEEHLFWQPAAAIPEEFSEADKKGSERNIPRKSPMWSSRHSGSFTTSLRWSTSPHAGIPMDCRDCPTGRGGMNSWPDTTPPPI